MSLRLVAIDEGPTIPIDREMVIIGRHPQCDARLDSIRVSRRHCCMTQDHGEIIVRDLGSTNGIRINGQRIEKGRLRPGDELSIAHIRFRVEGAMDDQDRTLAEPLSQAIPKYRPEAAALKPDSKGENGHHSVPRVGDSGAVEENPLAAAVRELLPSNVADRCRIQVIVQMQPESDSLPKAPEVCPSDSSP
jgi:predicted component of type VI protein secretion system